MNRNFTLEYWMDDNYFVGKLIEVPGVFSQAETLDQLVSNIKEVYYLLKLDDDSLEQEDKNYMEIQVEI
ncbi:MAG: type toxin-antitoxin system HicB family antitoxin [Ignavibacteria bacterium]|nr:type toxin-antitoxin system HicB family antitoxin [Ignavibacteria bacterium]